VDLTPETVLNDIDTLLLSGSPMILGRRSTLTPHTRNPVVMGAVLKNNQIAEKFYEYENDLVRVTVTVAEKPPHVLEEDRRKNGTRKRGRNDHPIHAD